MIKSSENIRVNNSGKFSVTKLFRVNKPKECKLSKNFRVTNLGKFSDIKTSYLLTRKTLYIINSKSWDCLDSPREVNSENFNESKFPEPITRKISKCSNYHSLPEKLKWFRKRKPRIWYLFQERMLVTTISLQF